MKKTLMTLAALAVASVAQATNFYWDGTQGNDWTTKYNWKTDAGSVQWIPTAGDCDVYIGANSAKAGNVTWNSNGWDLASLTLGNNSSATVTGWGDFKVETINISTGSTLAVSSDGDLGGFDGTTAMTWTGAVTTSTSPLFTLSARTFWGGDTKVIDLGGILDTSALTGKGTITLATINATNYSGGLSFDFTDLTAANATFAWVGTKGGNGSLVMTYDVPEPPATPDTPAVPEPTTATLSLLALAGLTARRRRK